MSSTRKVVTDNDKSPLIEILTLLFLVTVILACMVRIGTKIFMISALRHDDVLTVSATVFAVGQSIAVLVGCDHGLGKHVDILSSSDIDSLFKSQYAANAMFITSLFCSKMSSIMTLRMMSHKSQKWIILGCEAIAGIWGLTALVANLFQCRLPIPWAYNDADECINLTAFWTCHSIANIFTDVAFLIILVRNVLKIQTSLSRKILVMSVFGSRILVTPAIIVQIYYSIEAFGSADFTFSVWRAVIAIQLVQCLAIISLCIPSLKPFLDNLESGQIRSDNLRRRGKPSSNPYPTSRPGYTGYKKAENSRLGSGLWPSKTANVFGKAVSRVGNIHETTDLSKPTTHEGVMVATEEGTAGDGSDTSQIILIQQTWEVDVTDALEIGFRQN